jgi:hypothetical protein
MVKAFIGTYGDAEQYNKGARSQADGRPLKSWARIKRLADGSYEISIKNFQGAVLGILTPDNKFKFTLSDAQARSVQYTLGSSLHGALPFYWYRVATGRWKIVHARHIPRYGQYHSIMKKEAPEYFEGITFDLLTGDCVNRRPNLLSTVNPDARRVWRSKLTKFKRGIKVREKLGVFDTLLKESGLPRPLLLINFYTSEGVAQVAEIIKSETFSTESMKSFAYMAYTLHGLRAPTSVANTVDAYLRNHSIALRKHFNVFDNQGDSTNDNDR